MDKRYRIPLLICAIILPLDQLTKLAVEHYLPVYDVRVIIPGLLSLTHVENKGAAFGILAHHPFSGTIFTIVSIAAILLIVLYLARSKSNEVRISICLSLALAGAIGNLIDRIRIGRVIDFIDFHYKGWHWPAFNVADASITIGIILLAIGIVFLDKRES